LHGQDYGFIPDLDRMTAGEWVDMETYGFDPENLHKLMSILYRPVIETKGEKYLIASYTGNEDSEAMKDTPANIIIGVLLFFSRIVNDCMTCIPNWKEMIPTFIGDGGTLASVGTGMGR
jgi:hypothetical protein